MDGGIDYSTSHSYKPHDSMPDQVTFMFKNDIHRKRFEQFAYAILDVIDAD